MIDPEKFAQRQMELTAEFARYVLDHPEVDDSIEVDCHRNSMTTAGNSPSGASAKKASYLSA
jgi:hypothetical protein